MGRRPIIPLKTFCGEVCAKPLQFARYAHHFWESRFLEYYNVSSNDFDDLPCTSRDALHQNETSVKEYRVDMTG